MTSAFARGLTLAALLVLLAPAVALAGGGLSAADVPAPHAAAAPAAATPTASGGSSDTGCLPFEARNRAIPPRPRISASALLARAAQ